MSSPIPPPRRQRLVWLTLAGVLAAVALWWGWRWGTRPTVPEVDLGRVDPDIADAVRQAEGAARRQPRSAEAWAELGMVLMANKFEREAVLPFGHAERLDPADGRSAYLRGVALLGHDPEAALPCLRRAAAAFGSSRGAAEARLRLAEALAANGRPDEAEAPFREVAGALSPCAEYGLGALAAARGDLAGARLLLLRASNSPLTRQKASAALAAVLRRLGDASAAEYALRAQRLPADPPWPDVLLDACLARKVGREGRTQRANALERQGRLAEAVDVLRGVAHDYPEAESFLALGVVLGRAGQYRESEAYLRRCLDQEPGRIRALYYLSLALFAQGEALGRQLGRQADSAACFEEAARWARRATELAPHHGEAHFQLGLTLWCLHRRAEAAGAFRRAVAARPNLADAHLWLGRVLAEDGKKDEAERHLRDAVRFASEGDTRPKQALEQLLQGAKR